MGIHKQGSVFGSRTEKVLITEPYGQVLTTKRGRGAVEVALIGVPKQ